MSLYQRLKAPSTLNHHIPEIGRSELEINGSQEVSNEPGKEISGSRGQLVLRLEQPAEHPSLGFVEPAPVIGEVRGSPAPNEGMTMTSGKRVREHDQLGPIQLGKRILNGSMKT